MSAAVHIQQSATRTVVVQKGSTVQKVEHLHLVKYTLVYSFINDQSSTPTAPRLLRPPPLRTIVNH